jgi:tRNA/tmRNA/rRNA uracil-C5-methylase (TrmA/RlmC/RlmD family)
MTATGPDAGVGERIRVVVRAPVHGGHCLGHIPDDPHRRTVFVRHGLPGEEGLALVTAVAGGGRRVFADLVEVDRASPDRVAPPCPAAGPGRCGGCDLQHVALAAQRSWKAAVVADALRRTGGFDAVPWDGTVEAVPGDEQGLRWRTRSRFEVREGALAMLRHRSNEAIGIGDCPITAAPVVAAAADWARDHPASGPVLAVAADGGAAAQPTQVVQHHSGRRFAVAGFWQVHPGAPDALVGAVLDGLGPLPGRTALDLYGGVGLFAAALADGGAVRVDLVEGDRLAVALARENLADLPVRCHRSTVEPWLRRWHHRPDVVVLDPPRAGAGTATMARLARLAPDAVAYVACDPVAMARDLAAAGAHGYRLARLRAFDLFPMTHHVECVAVLERA